MAVPDLVRERLGDEPVRERVPLNGEDALVVSTDRTFLYRAEGLLSGESVETVPHAAESVSISEGRRKSSIRLDHGIDGESEFSVPSDRLDDVLVPLLGGVLSANDVTGPDESVEAVHRLGELTVVITEGRVIKHVGSAIWDREFEEYAFEDVTGVDIEEGDVSSQVIVEVEGRPQRIKTPSEDAREIRERIQRALLSYHDVEDYRAFERAVGEDEDAPGPDASEEEETPTDPVDGSEDTESPEEEERAEEEPDEQEESAFEFDEVEVEDEEETIVEEVAALREAVERQNELLEAHQRALETLIDELRD